jgi:hypothetical protein
MASFSKGMLSLSLYMQLVICEIIKCDDDLNSTKLLHHSNRKLGTGRTHAYHK